jgi:phosphate:Na+ symporter
MIFGVVGGLGLFYLGIRAMGDGLQKYAGEWLRNFLKNITKNRYVAMLTGLIVTAIIQSSSATTVMTVGLVNVGIISLAQAIGVVLGANIGTTVTAQLIAFRVQDYALPILGVGVLLHFFLKKEKIAYLGQFLTGFGMLFFGYLIMSDAFVFLREYHKVVELFASLDGFPLIAIFIGTIFTMIMQNSSVTVGITMALATTGLISFPTGVALVLGNNIGTTFTAQIAAIGTNISARRTAWAHTMFNVIGVCYIFALLPYYMKFVNLITPGDAGFVISTASEAARLNMNIGDVPYVARHIANAHSLFNIINAIIFLPMIGGLAKIVSWVVPGEVEKEEDFHLVYIKGQMISPVIAVEEARNEAIRMARFTLDMLDEDMRALLNEDLKKLDNVRRLEGRVDVMQKDITAYCVHISQESTTPEVSKNITSLINMVNNIERIGDHCENLSELIEKKKTGKHVFSEEALNGIRDIYHETRHFMELVIQGMIKQESGIKPEADRYEKRINYLEDSLRQAHIDRLNAETCTVEAGLVFIDMLTNFEKIGDHAFNLAEAVVGIK